MSSLRQRSRRKLRAVSRNAARAADNAAAPLSPDETMRLRIRAKAARRKSDEVRRATRLQAHLRQPAPDETVSSLQTKAEAQRALAAALDPKADAREPSRERLTARRQRKVYLKEAMRLDLEATHARERQLEAWRQALAAQEIEIQAKARGDELEDYITEMPEWVRDEHGALERDDRGLPKLRIEHATTRRQKHGLDWMLAKARITPAQYRTGIEAARIWAAAAQAAEPGRSEPGQPSAGKTSQPGPADWRLCAMRAAKQMEAAITSLVDGQDGAKIVATCKAVCFEGRTIQRLTANRYEQARAEERLKLGLALIRCWLETGGAPKIAA